jgi:hypothetical protein
MTAIWGVIGRFYIKQLQRDVLKYGQQLAIVNLWFPKPEKTAEEDDKKEQDSKKK